MILLIIFAVFLWVVFGGYFLWRNDGRWCIATTEPQICWHVGDTFNGRTKARPTGWSKVKGLDIWCK